MHLRRFNLSPFGEFSDGELWAALRRAHLAPAIQATQLGLDMVISEGGAPLRRVRLCFVRGWVWVGGWASRGG